MKVQEVFIVIIFILFSIKTRLSQLPFSLRAPQCMNYDEPKQSECTNEEKFFNITTIIFDIISTIRLKIKSLI